MDTLKHPCPNSACRVVLEIPRQLHWHHTRCSACGRGFDVPPTSHRLSADSRPAARRLRKAS